MERAAAAGRKTQQEIKQNRAESRNAAKAQQQDSKQKAKIQQNATRAGCYAGGVLRFAAFELIL